jgi:Zn-dependent M16 (insulinase) family peptidase
VRVQPYVTSLSNDDENKTFGVTFRTPPANSTAGAVHKSNPVDP